MSDSEIASPCMRRCTLDANDICVGCLRSIQEVMEWSQASDARKREILEAVERRRLIMQSRKSVP